MKIQVLFEAVRTSRQERVMDPWKLGPQAVWGDSVTWVSVAQVMQSCPLQATEGRGGCHSTRLCLGPVPPGKAHPEEVSEKVRSLWPQDGPEVAGGQEEV